MDRLKADPCPSASRGARIPLTAPSMKVLSFVALLPGRTVEENDFVLLGRMDCGRPTTNNPAEHSANGFSSRGGAAKVPALILVFSLCESRKITAPSPVHRRDPCAGREPYPSSGPSGRVAPSVLFRLVPGSV